MREFVGSRYYLSETSKWNLSVSSPSVSQPLCIEQAPLSESTVVVSIFPKNPLFVDSILFLFCELLMSLR